MLSSISDVRRNWPKEAGRDRAVPTGLRDASVQTAGVSEKMSSWSHESDRSVVEWLLEENNPSVRYLALTELLGISSRRRELVETRSMIPDWAPVKKMLVKQKRNGGWDDGRTWYLPKYKSTVWQLLILSQTGIDPETAPVRRMVDYSFKFQMPSGGFRSGMTPGLMG